MNFRESHNMIFLGEDISVSLALFQRCEPEYLPAAPGVRIWSESAQCLIINNTQQGDPFYTAERHARYVGRVEVYRRAMQASAFTAPSEALFDAGALSTLIED